MESLFRVLLLILSLYFIRTNIEAMRGKVKSEHQIPPIAKQERREKGMIANPSPKNQKQKEMLELSFFVVVVVDGLGASLCPSSSPISPLPPTLSLWSLSVYFVTVVVDSSGYIVERKRCKPSQAADWTLFQLHQSFRSVKSTCHQPIGQQVHQSFRPLYASFSFSDDEDKRGESCGIC